MNRLTIFLTVFVAIAMVYFSGCSKEAQAPVGKEEKSPQMESLTESLSSRKCQDRVPVLDDNGNPIQGLTVLKSPSNAPVPDRIPMVSFDRKVVKEETTSDSSSDTEFITTVSVVDVQGKPVFGAKIFKYWPDYGMHHMGVSPIPLDQLSATAETDGKGTAKINFESPSGQEVVAYSPQKGIGIGRVVDSKAIITLSPEVTVIGHVPAIPWVSKWSGVHVTNAFQGLPFREVMGMADGKFSFDAIPGMDLDVVIIGEPVSNIAIEGGAVLGATYGVSWQVAVDQKIPELTCDIPSTDAMITVQLPGEKTPAPLAVFTIVLFSEDRRGMFTCSGTFSENVLVLKNLPPWRGALMVRTGSRGSSKRIIWIPIKTEKNTAPIMVEPKPVKTLLWETNLENKERDRLLFYAIPEDLFEVFGSGINSDRKTLLDLYGQPEVSQGKDLVWEVPAGRYFICKHDSLQRKPIVIGKKTVE